MWSRLPADSAIAPKHGGGRCVRTYRPLSRTATDIDPEASLPARTRPAKLAGNMERHAVVLAGLGTTLALSRRRSFSAAR